MGGCTNAELWATNMAPSQEVDTSRGRGRPIPKHNLSWNEELVIGPDGARKQERLCWGGSATIYCSIVWTDSVTLLHFVESIKGLYRDAIKGILPYLMETRIMAKMRYFPSNGTTSDVGGIISTTSRKNTCRLMRIDIDSVTCGQIKLVSAIGDSRLSSNLDPIRRWRRTRWTNWRNWSREHKKGTPASYR